MEKAILFDLDFDMQLTSPYRFLERFSKIAKLDSVTFSLSHYMLELGLFDSKMNQFLPSLQAVAAIYTAKKYLKFYNNSFPEEVTTGLTEFGLSDVMS
jgi:cyclin B